jgi:hypothetical protein
VCTNITKTPQLKHFWSKEFQTSDTQSADYFSFPLWKVVGYHPDKNPVREIVWV